MSSTGVVLSEQTWSRVGTDSPDIAAADRDALGTTARLVVWPPGNLPRLLAAVDAELAGLDVQASRFRPDSEISALHAAGAGSYLISDGLAEAISIALAAAAWTGGLSDPTVGTALVRIGYDRDFAAIEAGTSAAPPPDGGPVAGWRTVRLNGNELTVPDRVLLDFGSTAKGLGADRRPRRPAPPRAAAASWSAWAETFQSQAGRRRAAGPQPMANGQRRRRQLRRGQCRLHRRDRRR